MKHILSKLISLLSLALVASCGQSRPTAKLLITNSFNISADGFTGGLVVTGESSKGKFTATTINGNSISLALDAGTWKFRAVGWDGGSPFSGAVYCGSISQNLSGLSPTVNINVSRSNCSNSEFGPRIKPLKIFNCSALLDSNDVAITTSTTSTLFDTNFCDDNVSLSPPQMETARYLKISIPSSLSSTGFPDIESNCLNTNRDPLLTYDLPLLNIPYKISLSDSSDCALPIEYSFPNGMIGANKPALSLVNLQSPDYNALFIPYQAKAPAQLLSFVVKDSSGNILPSNTILTEGQVISLNISGSDPHGRPVEYKFYRGGGGLATIQEWSSSDQATYTVASTDIGISGLKIYACIRNNDGVNYTNSTYYGDALATWDLNAPGAYSPADLVSMTVTDAGGNVLPSNSTVVEGETLTIDISATDSNGLPIEYVFYRGGGGLLNIQSWGTSSQVTYTIPSSDVGISGLKIYGAVRNNDGINFTNSTFYGDEVISWNYEAPGSYSPARITSLVVRDQSGNVLPSGATLMEGQVLSLEIIASDPNSLPLEYTFYRGGGGLQTIVGWNSSNISSYTVTSNDLGISGLKIYGSVRNNDGKDYTNSNYYGDEVKSWNFSAN